MIVTISDNYNNSYHIKLDVGVHKHIDIMQGTLLLDTKIIDGNICFLANTKEQIFVEKLMPLLKFGVLSTRYRDIYDLYWLITEGNLNKNLISKDMKSLIFNTNNEINNSKDIYNIVKSILSNKMFIQKLSQSNNWTGQNTITVTQTINDYLLNL